MKDYTDLEKKIGYNFNDKNLLLTALTHSSFVNENKKKSETKVIDNERLEFFGDAIIEFYVSDYLFNKYQSFPEGDMTKLRAAMVCEKSLAECAKEIDLGSYLRMGNGEKNSGGSKRASITSDAFEALTAAIYLDSNDKEIVKEFICNFLIKSLDNKNLFFDAKTKLQEISQQDPSNNLRYELVGETGPSHNKEFCIAVILNNKEIGRGVGHSKKTAEQNAAEIALKRLQNNRG